MISRIARKAKAVRTKLLCMLLCVVACYLISDRFLVAIYGGRYLIQSDMIATDRPMVIRASCGDVDVTENIRLHHTGRRLRIATYHKLDVILGSKGVGCEHLEVYYMYNGLAFTENIRVLKTTSGMFLEKDLLVPRDLSETYVPESEYIPYRILLDRISGLSGLEVGGPSIPFKYRVTIYPALASLDNVNFALKTIWEINDGHDTMTYVWDDNKPKGVQYILDVTDLSYIRKSGRSYDIVLSAHMLEHILNPMKAMREMTSLIKRSGYLLLMVPYKHECFDRYRDYSTFDDILGHYAKGDEETGNPHVNEILQFHDLSMDPPAGSFDSFSMRSMNNTLIRGLHQHVFHPLVLKSMCIWFDLDPIVEGRRGLDMYLLCQKR